MSFEAIVTYSVMVDQDTLHSCGLDEGWDTLDEDQKRSRILDAADYIAQTSGFNKPLIVSCSDPSLEE